jgi:hypothetical protein
MEVPFGGASAIAVSRRCEKYRLLDFSPKPPMSVKVTSLYQDTWRVNDFKNNGLNNDLDNPSLKLCVGWLCDFSPFSQSQCQKMLYIHVLATWHAICLSSHGDFILLCNPGNLS